jgi:hypothetical protein
MHTIVPLIADYYYSVAQAAVAALDPPVTVYLGEPTGGDIPHQYVAVMYAGPDRPAVLGSRQRQTHSEHWAEEFDLWVSVSTASGDENGPAQMADTEALFALVVDALAADRSCGGVVPLPGLAEYGSYEWTVEQGGSVATVFFTMHVRHVWGM